MQNALACANRIFDLLEEEDISACNQSDYIYHNAGYPIHGNTTAEYFQVGDDMFPVLVRELEQGKETLRLDKVNQLLDFFNYEMVAMPKKRNDETREDIL